MTTQSAKGPVLFVDYKDKAALYNCYMSFIKDGGLFIPCSHQAHLGEPVFLYVRLPDNPKTFLLAGKVMWVAMGRRKGMGVSIAMDENGKQIKTALDQLLAPVAKSANPTYTM